jgi:hypothetical protein
MQRTRVRGGSDSVLPLIAGRAGSVHEPAAGRSAPPPDAGRRRAGDQHAGNEPATSTRGTPMARKSENTSRPIFHAPMLIDWTEERLQALSQEQLLNLLDNLDRQKKIGRLQETDAAAMDQRISALLTKASATKRRKQLAQDDAAAVAES